MTETKVNMTWLICSSSLTMFVITSQSPRESSCSHLQEIEIQYLLAQVPQNLLESNELAQSVLLASDA